MAAAWYHSRRPEVHGPYLELIKSYLGGEVVEKDKELPILKRYTSSLRRCPHCGDTMKVFLDAHSPWAVCQDCSYMERFEEE